MNCTYMAVRNSSPIVSPHDIKKNGSILKSSSRIILLLEILCYSILAAVGTELTNGRLALIHREYIPTKLTNCQIGWRNCIFTFTGW